MQRQSPRIQRANNAMKAAVWKGTRPIDETFGLEKKMTITYHGECDSPVRLTSVIH